jgi:hypothetical protein
MYRFQNYRVPPSSSVFVIGLKYSVTFDMSVPLVANSDSIHPVRSFAARSRPTYSCYIYSEFTSLAILQ